MDGADIPSWLPIALMAGSFAMLALGTGIVIRRKLRKQKLGKFGWAVLVLWGFGAISAIAQLKEENKPPEQRAAEEQAKAERSRLAYLPDVVKAAVKQQLRDPESAKFGKMDAYGDRKLNGISVVVICGSVNAKNGFGGYGGEKNFLFVKETMSAVIDTDTNNGAFVKLWNALCAGKHS